MTQKEIETFYPRDRNEWRDWLDRNHSVKESIWLIYYKKKTGKPSVPYSDAVDEALCFGWIDSKAKSIDEERTMQFFCKRKAGSVWSKINKAKVNMLIDSGLMTEAGFACIETAKKNGMWTKLDDVEALIIPPDLEKALNRKPKAKTYFLSLSRTNKRNMLQWLVLAKRPETRLKRINEIVELAAQKQRPKQFR